MLICGYWPKDQTWTQWPVKDPMTEPKLKWPYENLICIVICFECEKCLKFVGFLVSIGRKCNSWWLLEGTVEGIWLNCYGHPERYLFIWNGHSEEFRKRYLKSLSLRIRIFWSITTLVSPTRSSLAHEQSNPTWIETWSGPLNYKIKVSSLWLKALSPTH